MMSVKPVDYVTVIEPVFEVMLLGHAKTQIWSPYLENEEIDTHNLQD